MDIEIKWEQRIWPRLCDVCNTAAFMEGAIGPMDYLNGRHFAYCKEHYSQVFDLYEQDVKEEELMYDDED